VNTLLFGLAVAVGAPALKEAKPDPSPVGEWTVESSVFGGKDDGVMREAPIEKIVITPDRWTVVRNGDLRGGSQIAINPKKDPPEIDFDPGMGAGGIKGIYRLDGDTLTVCYTLRGDRPTKVESPAGSQIQMMTLKRIKK
jgi:uncharacterized protein (TIGR03067 family)